MNYAVIVAGGKGLRMGGPTPKQYIAVGGVPILMRTLRAFRAAVPDCRLILVLPADHHGYWRELCRSYSFDVPCLLATGGETRFHSVKAGLALIPEGEEGVVAVHDGVRPFVPAEVIRRCFAEAERRQAVVPVVKVVETLRHVSRGTVPRDEYRLVQTPQTFSIATLRHAYAQPYTEAFTDDASVVEADGVAVTLVEGSRLNIKITTPDDLRLAGLLCADPNAGL